MNPRGLSINEENLFFLGMASVFIVYDDLSSGCVHKRIFFQKSELNNGFS